MWDHKPLDEMVRSFNFSRSGILWNEAFWLADERSEILEYGPRRLTPPEKKAKIKRSENVKIERNKVENKQVIYQT